MEGDARGGRKLRFSSAKAGSGAWRKETHKCRRAVVGKTNQVPEKGQNGRWFVWPWAHFSANPSKVFFFGKSKPARQPVASHMRLLDARGVGERHWWGPAAQRRGRASTWAPERGKKSFFGAVSPTKARGRQKVEAWMGTVPEQIEKESTI